MNPPAAPEHYTPGLGPTAVAFMAERHADTHADFFLPHLSPGLSVADIGCGPGTITAGLAAAVAPGPVLGIDQGTRQLRCARARLQARGVDNAHFQAASCYRLPLPDRAVDRVLAHALLEHLAEPDRALAEFHRVLRPGGVIGVCSPDWGGFLLTPATEDLDRAVAAYRRLQHANGGDPEAGRKLPGYLARQGFTDVRVNARYECHADSGRIAAYLAEHLDAADLPEQAGVLRDWAAQPAALFAQAWVSATAVRAALGARP